MNSIFKTLLLAAFGATCLVLASENSLAGAPATQQKIVYHCRGAQDTGGTDICSVNADGSSYEHLTTDSTEDSFPRLSPNGREIVWRRDIIELWIMDSDGSNQRQLVPDVISTFGSVTWSPDGKTIAATCSNPDNSTQAGICTIDRDSEVVTFLHLLDQRPDYIEWNPVDANTLLLEEEAGGNTDLFIFNMQSGDMENITETPSEYEHGAWSPDGTRLAFVGSPLPDDNVSLTSLYTIDPDGSDRELLFTSDWGATSTSPAWSPEGDLIAYFCSHSDVGAPELCLVEPTGGLDGVLTEGETDQYYLGSSPDWGLINAPIFGDFDCDGDVDGDDLLVLLGTLNGGDAQPCISLDGNEVNHHAQPAADLNCDGDVDALDGLAILYFKVGMPSSATECTAVGSAALIFEV